MAMVAHAYAALDAYIYGFALTKMTLPFDAATDMAEMAEAMLAPFPADEYPNPHEPDGESDIRSTSDPERKSDEHQGQGDEPEYPMSTAR